jgi:hypothetical protein
MKPLGLLVSAMVGGAAIAVGGQAEAGLRAASAPPAPPKGYKLQERLLIPVMAAAGVETRKPLAAGRRYLLRVTGTFFEGVGFYGPGYGDAEYGFYKTGQVIDGCRNGVDLGVGINDTNVSPGHRKRPRWGRYHANHVYSRSLTGAGARIRVDYHDCAYPDNRPSTQWPGTPRLTLWVYARAG